jgi:predicted lipid-binding transport protein (Tim44 family)
VALFILIAVFLLMRQLQASGRQYTSGERPTSPPTSRNAAQPPSAIMRRVDPTFSEPLFLEWASLLYVRANEALGDSDLDAVRPYFTERALATLAQSGGGAAIKDVKGVIIGSISLLSAEAVADGLEAVVAFHANRTVVEASGREQAFYVHETWRFWRAKGVRSREPAGLEKLGCPSCGSPVERSSLNRCAHCQAALQPGASDWSVAGIEVRERQTRPPLLTGQVEEVGTDLPTITSPTRERGLREVMAADPTFTVKGFEEQVKRIFFALQEGWSTQRWSLLRPNETDALFQSHRFWLEEYQRQKLRNVLEKIELKRVELAKVEVDAYYDAITCRLFAKMRDSTVRVGSGQVVSGSAKRDRDFTEYWTLIRRRGVQTRANDATTCPNCGAPLVITQSGICESCDAKICRGDFSWVLSRIEQDEEYRG